MTRIAILLAATIALAGCQGDSNVRAAAFQSLAAQGMYMPPVQAPYQQRCFTRAAPTLYGAPVMQTQCW